MLTKLEIHNFRGIEHLELEDLPRINLIVGKNNTNKTTLLEAIRLLEAQGHSTVLNHLLKNHDQFIPSNPDIYAAFLYSHGEKKPALCSLVGTFKATYGKYTNSLVLGGMPLQGPEQLFQVAFHDGRPPFAQPASLAESDRRTFSPDPNASPDHPRDQCIFLPPLPLLADLQAWWDAIALTPLEDTVVELLQKIIDPRIEKLDLSNGKARVKLKDYAPPQPLRSLGDGVQRVLALILALVNARGKRLLIDEIEIGLHYSTLESLWQSIFEYAEKHDVQIFATTHSRDAVWAFNLANLQVPQGQVLRLQFDRSGVFQAIPYTQRNLEEVLDLDLEIR